MGSFNNSILPSNTGLSLGSLLQKWQLYSTTVTADQLTSTSLNTARSGFIRLASSDQIAWRNAANSGDVLLVTSGAATANNVPADSLVFNSYVGTFVSSNGTPSAPVATGGVLRMAASDTVNFRNNAGSADVVALAHNSDDTIQVGGAAGIDASAANISGNLTVGGAASVTGNLTASGNLSLTGNLNGLTVSGGNITSATNTPIAITSTGPSSAGAGTSLTLNAGNAFGGSNLGGNIVLTPGGSSGAAPPATIQLNGKVSKYGASVSTVGNGLVAEYAAVDLIGQNAAISTTTLYAVPPGVFGPTQFRVSWNAKVTTAAGTSSTLGPLTIVYTDFDGTVQTITAPASIAAGTIATSSTGNTTTTVLLGIPLMLNCQLNSNINYAFAYASNAAGIMQYSLHMRLEAL